MLLRLWICLGLLIALISLILGVALDQRCYAGLLLLVPIALVCYALRRRSKAQQRLDQLRSTWGREDTRSREFERIEKQYRLCVGDADPENSLDNQTWADLNLDDVYSKIDRTFSTPGETVLYSMLRRPEIDGNLLKDRGNVIRLWETNQQGRETLRLALLGLGREASADPTSLLWGQRPAQIPFRWLFPLLAWLALATLVTPFFWGQEAWIWFVIPLFAVNLLITSRVRRRVLFRLSTLRYLGSLINAGAKIGRLAYPEVAKYTEDLTRLAAATSPLVKKARLLDPGRGASGEMGDILNEYVGTFFLVEVRIFCKILRELEEHLDELRRLYWLVGELDALQSAASFRASLPGYTEPEFVDNGLVLELTDGCHPLLSDPVPNSIAITSKGVFVSGSNMAGKSTFLRTVGVNAILAQTISTCCAAAYRGSLFRIISSINQADRLDEGKSYYLKEAERLLAIIRAAEGTTPPLCIVDELLKGTNSAERFSASVEIVKYLCQQRAIVIVASHDIDLARILQDQCANYHFSDRFEGGGLQFDYRLRKGISSTRNAITLLESLGYPPQIVESARRRLASRHSSPGRSEE